MDLKSTINNTNKQKENVKKVATNIDNKLVELGGERATDLNDVVNKMGAMVGQYKKVARQQIKKEIIQPNITEKKVILNFNPILFTPKDVFIFVKSSDLKKCNLITKADGSSYHLNDSYGSPHIRIIATMKTDTSIEIQCRSLSGLGLYIEEIIFIG